MITEITMKTQQQYTVAMLAVLVFAVIMAGFAGCDLIDPTEVRNPQITEESILGQPGSMRAALQGVRTLFSDVVDNTAYFTDVVSDNYDNWQTFISPNADFPRSIRSDDLTLNGLGSMYAVAQRTRAHATFAIEQVAPKDPTTTGLADMVAEVILYRGLTTLIMAENFSYVPLTTGGAPVPASELLNNAVADLTTALNTGPTAIRTAAQFALARAYRLQGKKAEAAAAAAAALAISTNYVFLATFDAQTNTNAVWTFTVSRNLHDMQPLPRLDFLDPKYTNPTGISPIPVLKAEEMYLIQAEIAISNNDLATAKARMKDAIALATGTANGRTTVQFTDPDPRTNRPNADNITVKADPNAPARAGLVKRRSGSTVTIKQISNTSVTAADVDALVSAQDHLWMLYLLRQEIFFAEGRRMSDLGIRLPMMKREEETNPSIKAGDPGTTVVVPSYIPPNDDMDKFTISGTVVTINIDMNRVLAANKVSPFPMPF
jgi:hypothetical protein